MKDILVVEDGKSERDRLQKLFTDAGYGVDVCESVGEAEKAVQRETYRLAVLDIGLNDKSGSLLFTALRRGDRVTYIVIFTGNPSIHLKQRFLNEGAVDYIVKGSAAAQSDTFLSRIRDILGGSAISADQLGLPLEEFLRRCVTPVSRGLFLAGDGTVPSCQKCSSQSYVVTFASQPQVPPGVIGVVVCAQCGSAMDPEIS